MNTLTMMLARAFFRALARTQRDGFEPGPPPRFLTVTINVLIWMWAAHSFRDVLRLLGF